MTQRITEGKLGIAQVVFYEVSKMESTISFIRARRGDQGVPPGRYAKLLVNGGLMMSNTPMEMNSNVDFVCKANGHVLIAGLGLGMVLDPLSENSEVDTITVVEKYQDVIDLVGPHYSHPNISIVLGDIIEWSAPVGKKWDTIYFDIWPDICVDNLKEMATLHRRFARRLNKSNPKSWMGSWSKSLLQYYRNQEKGNTRCW